MSIDCLHLQVAELEALAAAADAEGGRLLYTPSEDANIALAQAGVEVNNLPSHLDPLSGTLVLQGARLGFTMPPTYPLHASPHLLLQLQGRVSRTDHDRIQDTLVAVVQQYQGDCCMLMVLATLVQQQQTLLGTAAGGDGEGAPADDHVGGGYDVVPQGHHHQQHHHQQQGTAASSMHVRRVLIWFHHIVNLTKRKNIVSWARELDLRGYSKPGWPGVVVIEGMEEDVEEYVSRLRALQWQAMHVRADETAVDGAWCFREGFVELDPENDGWGKLSRACRECGLEALFATALKL